MEMVEMVQAQEAMMAPPAPEGVALEQQVPEVPI
jgi:hypothetical protein